MGLDSKAIKELKRIFMLLKDQGCTIISTHMLDSVDEFWDKVLIMEEVEIILSKTRQELADSEESLEKIFFDATECVSLRLY